MEHTQEQAELFGLIRQPARPASRLRINDVVRIDGRLCLVIRVTESAAVVLMNRPRRQFNVCLQHGIDKLSSGLGQFDEVHGYPMEWYGGTVEESSRSFLGFANSFEARGQLPPSGGQYVYGLLYLQAGSLQSPYPLRLANDAEFTQCQQEILKRVGGFVVAKVEHGVGVAVETVGNVLVETGNVIVETAVSAFDAVQDAGTEIVDFIRQPALRIRFGSGGQSGLHALRASSDQAVSLHQVGTVTATNSFAWFTTKVPESAAFVVFDFTLAGSGADDSVAFGLNGTNVFTLETKFVRTNVTANSTAIDVAAIAGQNAELFFGLLGGTSTNCVLTVENIRFLSGSGPQLGISAAGGQTVLSWPAVSADYALEVTPSLVQPTWTAVTNSPALSHGRYSVSVPPSSEAQFFRLRQR